MPQSLDALYVHLVFGTLDRRAFLDDRSTRLDMHAAIAGISKRQSCPTVIVGGVSDHVHVLSRLSRMVAVSTWVKEIKRQSSIWGKEHVYSGFAWQAGYGAFSVSESDVATVENYISRQEEHHKTVDFESEYLAMLTEHRVAYDARFVLD